MTKRQISSQLSYIANHPAAAIIFSKTEDTWNKIKNVYTGSFRELVFGALPDESEILKTLKIIANRLKQIQWVVKP